MGEQSLAEALANTYDELSGTSEAADTPPSSEPDGQEPTGAPEPITAPEHWPDTQKAIFDGLSDDHKQFMLDRETEFARTMTEKGEEISQLKSSVDPIDQILNPFKPQIQAQGLTNEQFLGQILGSYQQLQNPMTARATLEGLAQAFNIDLSPKDASDDDFLTESDEVVALRKQVQELTDIVQQNQSNLSQYTQSQVNAEIEAFSSQKDENGNLLRPYFEDVKNEMAPYVQQGKSMDEAYRAAVYFNEGVQEKIRLATEATKREAEEAARKKKVADAKKSVVPKGETQDAEPVDDKPKTLADELSRNWDQLTGGA